MASMGHGNMIHHPVGGAGHHPEGTSNAAGGGPMHYGPGPVQQHPGQPQQMGGPPPGHPPQQPPQQKELNAAMLCRFGQETVQEIVGRALEMFQILKQTQPPDGKTNVGMDRKNKFQETLKSIKGNFKRLRVIYEKIEETFPTKTDIAFEEEILNKSDDNLSADDKRNTESYKQALEEYKESMELVMIKNRHLKDTIDHLRTMIWDINTMLAMRKE